MASQLSGRLPWWSWTWPVLAFAILGVKLFVGTTPVLSVIAGVALMATVFAAVYHAEVVAHKVGEPMGTIVLAVAVTVIEVALIVSALFVSGAESVGLPRDTVFAAVMIVCNGIVGLCLLVGGVRHFEQGFQLRGASAALAVLAALTTLTMVLPNFTTSKPGPVFNPAQLLFAGAASLILYWRVYFCADRSSSQLLSTRGWPRTDSRRASFNKNHGVELRLVVSISCRSRGSGEVAYAHH